MLFLISFPIELLVLNAIFNLVYLHNLVMNFGLFCLFVCLFVCSHGTRFTVLRGDE